MPASTTKEPTAEADWAIRWCGPMDHQLEDRKGLVLKRPVPPRNWPHGPPDEHQAICELKKPGGGRFCDCRLASEPDFDARFDEERDKFDQIIIEPELAAEYIAGGASWWWEIGRNGEPTGVQVIRRIGVDDTYVCKVPLVTPHKS